MKGPLILKQSFFKKFFSIVKYTYHEIYHFNLFKIYKSLILNTFTMQYNLIQHLTIRPKTFQLPETESP